MNEREQLMQLIARSLPTVPSVLSDKILSSKWLREHDERIESSRSAHAR